MEGNVDFTIESADSINLSAGFFVTVKSGAHHSVKANKDSKLLRVKLNK